MDRQQAKLPLLWGFLGQVHLVPAATGVQFSFPVHPDFLEGPSPLPGIPLIQLSADEELEIVYLSVIVSWTPPAAATFEVYDPSFEIDLKDGAANTQAVFQRRALATPSPGLGQDIPFAANIFREATFELPPTSLRARDLVFSTGTLRFLNIFLDIGLTNSGGAGVNVTANSTIALRRTQAERY